MQPRSPNVAVVGHIEWVQFARVAHLPVAGEVAHAHDTFEEPAGGGAVAAVQLARLAGAALLITAVGDDELGQRSIARLRELGVSVSAATRPEPTRRALTLVDDAGERTITTLGQRLQPLRTDDALPWERLAKMDAVYFTAGDRGALQAARAAACLLASPRAVDAVGKGVELDALVLSADDQIERAAAAGNEREARLVVLTEGARGGSWRDRSGHSGSWPATPTQAIDSYGCGDSFAAGLAYGLGRGLATAEALTLAARCGERCLTGRGPYERQLSAADL